MSDLWTLIGQSLRLDERLWLELIQNPDALRFRSALWIVLLAGLSEGVAQSVALFLNQVKPRRILLSLLVNALIFTFGYFFYVLSISLVVDLLRGAEQPPGLLFKTVALAYAPLIFAFLTLIPYFGRAIAIVLSVYHFLVLLLAVALTYGLEPAPALLAVAGGWLLLALVRGTVGRPLTYLARRARNFMAGTTLRDRRELRSYLEELMEQPEDDAR